MEVPTELVALAPGEVVRRSFEGGPRRERRLVRRPERLEPGVALTVTGADGWEITVDPVGKAFELFENGSEDSLA